MVRHLPLENSPFFVLVDDGDFELAASRSWYLNAGGYAVSSSGSSRRGDFETTYLHRLLLGLEPGDFDYGDHINKNRLDCRQANLRVLTSAQSAQNRSKGRERSGQKLTSRYRGVSFAKNRKKAWLANGYLDGKSYNLGYFETELEAAQAASDWRRQYMPFSVEEPI
jgi:hypothetical protein